MQPRLRTKAEKGTVEIVLPCAFEYSTSMANDIQIRDKASCDVSAAVLSEIHVKSDPNSLWGCLGTSYTEELLYKPLTQDPNSSIALAQYKGKYIGFVAVTKIKPKRDNFLVLPYFSLVTYSEIILKVFKSKNSVQRLVTFYISSIRTSNLFLHSHKVLVVLNLHLTLLERHFFHP